uniref:Uncharacterized protein n=1 Tax=Populus alba TaxID=43335 RepID=A0A4U5R774_POPAL|nr:hypothetical protein D5086_0000006980 [Populus alba]
MGGKEPEAKPKQKNQEQGKIRAKIKAEIQNKKPKHRRERSKGQRACFACVLKTQVKCRETASAGQPNYSSPATHFKPSEEKHEKAKGENGEEKATIRETETVRESREQGEQNTARGTETEQQKKKEQGAGRKLEERSFAHRLHRLQQRLQTR